MAKTKGEGPSLPCAVVYDDDGIDPRRFFRSSDRSSSHRKDLQLCAQVARAVADALADGDDPELQLLQVERVTLCPHAGRLLVVLRGSPGGEGAGRREAELAIAAFSDRILDEVAASIHRKRLPHLRYLVLEPEEVGP